MKKQQRKQMMKKAAPQQKPVHEEKEEMAREIETGSRPVRPTRLQESTKR